MAYVVDVEYDYNFEMMGTSAEIMLLSLASMQMPGAAEKLFAAAQVFYKK